MIVITTFTFSISNPIGAGFVLTESDPQHEPLQPLDE